MDINNKIHDTFNPPPSLDGEKWLTPSASVWDEIEKEIKPRKKNRIILFFILGLLALILLVSILYSISKTPAKDSMNTSSVPIEIIDTNNDYDGSQLIEKSLVDGNKEQNKTYSAKQKFDHSLLTANSKIASNDLKFLPKRSLNTVAKNKKDINNDHAIDNLITDNSLEEQSIQTNAESSVLSTNYTVEKSVEHLYILRTKIDKLKDNNTSTGFINSAEFDALLIPNIEIAMQDALPIIPESSPGKNLGQSITFSSGMSLWNINMNDNYLSALEPANFNANNGSGYYLELGYKKYFSNRFFAQLSGGFEHVEFQSGHNSVVEYSLDQEPGQQINSFDVIMASPIGFLESNIEISRREFDTPDNQSLTIDLHNSHRIGEINGLIQAGFDIIQHNRWKLDIVGGMGYSYLIYNNNNLDRFGVDNNDFETSASMILSNQNDVNKLRPYFSLSSSIIYKISHRSNLFFQYSYNQDLKNVYQFEDFSTRISRQQIGIGLEIKIN